MKKYQVLIFAMLTLIFSVYHFLWKRETGNGKPVKIKAQSPSFRGDDGYISPSLYFRLIKLCKYLCKKSKERL